MTQSPPKAIMSRKDPDRPSRMPLIRSFKRMVWRMRHGMRKDETAPSPDRVHGMAPQQVDMNGVNP